MTIVIGVVLFLTGGVILALRGGVDGTAIGTTVALAGVVLLVWGWLGARGSDE